MIRRYLLETKVLLRKGATYSLTSMLIFGVFGSLFYLLSHYYFNVLTPVSLMIATVAVFIAASIFQPVLSRLQCVMDRWVFRERYDDILALSQFSKEIKGNLDLEQLATSLVNMVANGMQSIGVYLLLPSPATGNYVSYMYAGKKHQGLLRFLANSPLVAIMKHQNNVIDNSRMKIIPSLNGLPINDRQTLERNNIKLLVPLKHHGYLSGILLLGSKISDELYSSEEKRLLETISTDVAISIKNASLYNNMMRKHRALQEVMNGVIHAVSLVVESRDPYTAGHQWRVAELARVIAIEMGIPEWQIMGIHVAGLIHDVGKVSVPSEILNKPGKINENEFSIIRNHSQVGYEILKRIDFPWPVTKAIHQHHERLDGSGYPEGLEGKDIVLEARILAVADVVEAMSSHRPYRPALGLESALEEISQASGILYDSKVVDACLRLLKKKRPEFDRIMAVAAAHHDYELQTVLN